jgi:hypothetical protein
MTKKSQNEISLNKVKEYIDEAIKVLGRFPEDAEILYCIRTYNKCKAELERIEALALEAENAKLKNSLTHLGENGEAYYDCNGGCSCAEYARQTLNSLKQPEGV